jgi:hypothetical protein
MTTMSKIKVLISYIKARRKSEHTLLLLWALAVLKFKKFFKVDFDQRCASTESIDLVIPTVPKDLELLLTVIEAAKRHILNPIQGVYIIAPVNEHLQDFCTKYDITFIDETNVLSYGKDSITYSANGVDRSGWIFQQLLKLHASAMTRAENYLIIDSDTVLLRDICFLQNGRALFQQGEEWHEPYNKAFRYFFGESDTSTLTYVVHMMLFNRKMLAEMKAEMEERHHKSWDKVYLRSIDETEQSCVADYTTYACWVHLRHPERMRLAPFYNKSFSRKQLAPLEQLEAEHGSNFNSISFHSYTD